MDRLTGRITSPARPAQADRGTAAVPGQDAVRGSGAGFEYSASGLAGRVHERREATSWLACVGAPYAASGAADAGTALGGFGTRGADLLAGLGGEFVLAWFDTRARVLILATDRFASIPLYYATGADEIAFGTDPASLKECLPAAVGLDPQALYDYLFFSVVPSNRSILSGARRLPPASMLIARDGHTEVLRYWRPDFSRGGHAPENLGALTFDALSAAVARLASLPDAGCFLSGGLDSSSVCGFAARHMPGKVRAFTIGFDVPDYDESRYAQISARHFGLDLRAKRIGSADVTACLDRVIGAFPEPFGNASAVSAYLCAELAREAGVRHLLAGDGGDELFAGNERYQKQRVFNVYGELPGWLRGAAIDPLARMSRVAPAPLGKLASYVEQARIPLPDRLFGYNLLARNDPGTVLTPEFLKNIDPREPYDYARSIYAEPADGDALDRMLYLDWTLTLTDNDLPKVRAACDLAGVAVHFPMLDPEVVRLSTRVPSNEKLTLRELRRFYKRAFRGFLPPEVIAKSKHGFGVPVGIWITEDPALRERVHSRLASLGRRGIVRQPFIDELLRLQQTTHAVYYGALLWQLFMLEEWLLAHAP